HSARFGDAEMERIVATVSKLLICGDGKEYVGCLYADFEFGEVILLQQPHVPVGTFYHRFGTGFPILFEQIAFEGTGIDTYAHRTAMILGGFDNLTHAMFGADIAGIDAQAGRAGFRGFDGPPVMKMDIGNDWYLRSFDDGFQRPCGI